MPNPSGSDRDNTSDAADRAATDDRVESEADTPDDKTTETQGGADPATEVIGPSGQEPHPPMPALQPGERRFTAPGFDAKETAIISAASEPATEVFAPGRPPAGIQAGARFARPQLIPPRLGAKFRPASQRSWGWVLALILIILAFAAIAVLGTVLLTRNDRKPHASQEDQVRNTIQHFDAAVQTGDLTTLRSITCGTMRDDYVTYDQNEWNDVYHRVAAAGEYPVVASIDQVVVNGNHAEANVTAFVAYAPQTRSVRSFDLQYRDDQWKICESSSG
jgi:enamine deaminase RidA (YjgF/YER057c/UK114 family)